MTNGTVGVTQAAAPDRLIDNEALTIGGQAVHRQRVAVVPPFASTYQAGTGDTTANVAAGQQLVAISVHALAGVNATITLAGGATITVPAGAAFTDSLVDAPILGPCAVVVTNSAAWYIRTTPAVA